MVKIWAVPMKLGARLPQKILISYTVKLILIYQLPIVYRYDCNSSVKTTLVIINDTKQMNNVNIQHDVRVVELEFLKVLASDNFDLDRLKIAISLSLTAFEQS